MMSRGMNLMLAGICIIGNITKDPNNEVYPLADPDRYNWNAIEARGPIVLSSPLEKSNVIRVATLETMPYSGTKKLPNSKIIGIGHAFDILNVVFSKLNLTYKIVMPKVPGIGNSTSGLLGLLHNKEIDMVAAFTPYLWSYKDKIWFSPVVETVDVMALMQRPRESAVGSGLLAPFDTTVWICILVCTIIFGPVIYVFSNYRSYLWDYTKVDRFNRTSSVWFVYGAILKQGSSLNPMNNSTRIVFATWWVFITILTSFYTANLTAFLTLSEFTLPFTTMGGIIEKKISWLAAKEHTASNLIDTGHGKRINSLWGSYKRFGYIKPVNHTDDILKDLNKKRLFVGERELLEESVYHSYIIKVKENYLEKYRCQYVIMPEVIYEIPRVFMHQRNSPFREDIDKKLSTLFEVGVFTYYRRSIAPKVKYCPLNLKSTERILTNLDLALTWKIIGGGFVTSILTFIYEMMKTRKDRKCLCCRSKCSCCRSRLKIKKETVIQTVPELPKRNNFVQKFNKDAVNENIKNNMTRNVFKNELSTGKISPIYESIHRSDTSTTKKIYINGRDYLQITEPTGDRKLIPIRTPSALLFQYRK